MYTVYILYSALVDRYYVSFTSDLESQIKRHNKGRNIYTKSGIPWKLVYSEKFKNRTEALNRENKIKSSNSRQQLREIIRSKFNTLS